MMRGALLYEGKGKQLFASDVDGELIQLFKDDATAFDGVKHEIITGKGVLNCAMSTFFFERLREAGIETHFIRREGEREMRVKRLAMIPVEVVVRNVAAGSISKRLGIEEGTALARPLTELFYKSDALHDPMITEDHAELFGWAARGDIEQMRNTALSVNDALSSLLAKAGIRLIDFKLEFGRAGGEILVGDEITPDGCRLWDAGTSRKLDKDVFRRDLGSLPDAYREVAGRLGIRL